MEPEQPAVETPLPAGLSSNNFLDKDAVLDALANMGKLMALSSTALNGAAYYNEKWATWSKDILDKLHNNLTPVKVTVDGLSVKTIRLRYYQGKRYLLDKLDPTQRYAELAACTKCRSEEDTGCLMFFVRKRKAVSIPTLIAHAKWKEGLQDFLDTAVHGQKLAIPDILLSEAELLWIEAQLIPIADLFVNVSDKNQLLIYRVDKDKL